MLKKLQKFFGLYRDDEDRPLPMGLSVYGKRCLEKRLRDAGLSWTQAVKAVSIVSAYLDERDFQRDVVESTGARAIGMMAAVLAVGKRRQATLNFKKRN